MREINKIYHNTAADYRQSDDNTLSPDIIMREILRPYFETLQKYDWQNFGDSLLKRQFEVLLRGSKYPPMDDDFKAATKILKSLAKMKFVCSRRKNNSYSNFGCSKVGFIHRIKSIITNSDDLEEVKWYWTEWRNRMPSTVINALHYYVQYYQNMSTPEMPASVIWYAEYEDPNFINELEELIESLKPFYREMHAHLKQALHLQYGDDVIPSSGLIPHHLLEQSMYQSWKKQSVLRNPFPESKLPNLQQEMDNLEMFPFDLVNISSQFFNSMGLSNLTE